MEDEGRTILKPGDVCAWAMGVANGHHLINESTADCTFIAMSAGNAKGGGGYADINMKFRGGYFHKDGTPYPPKQGG